MTTKIKVGVRIRPFLENEKKQGHKNSKIIANSNQKQVLIQQDNQNNRSFKFDHIFDESMTQEDVYKEAEIDKYIQQVLEGYHSSIFAYGQTGSGKTYTMEGFEYQQGEKGPSPKLRQDPQQYGLIPRIAQQLFEKIKSTDKRFFTVSCSFLQIYNEKIYDLLNPASIKTQNFNSTDGWNQGGLRLRWNQSDQFQVENLFIFECKNADEIMKFFQYGIKNRIVSSHKLNQASSRSHTILTIRVESMQTDSDNHRFSKLELVDLAGSERIGQTGTEGKLAKESIDINKSLFTLRQVITSLSEISKNPKSKDQAHIPYRESKLTSLLKQSIGGNSYCLMLACLQPSDTYIDENLSTLAYATKAATIQCEPVLNNDRKDQQIHELREENKMLKLELEKANKHIDFLSQIAQQQQAPQIIQPYNMQIQQQKQQRQMPNQQDIMIQKQSFQIPVINGNIDYEHFSDRLIESISMVRELLYSNKELREITDVAKRRVEQVEHELIQLQAENQDLRDQLNMSSQTDLKKQIFKQTIRSEVDNSMNTTNYVEDTIEIYDNGTLNSKRQYQKEIDSPVQEIVYKNMSRNDLITEILNFRREKKVLEQKLKQSDIDRSASMNSGGRKYNMSPIMKQSFNKGIPQTDNQDIIAQQFLENQKIYESKPSNIGQHTYYQTQQRNEKFNMTTPKIVGKSNIYGQNPQYDMMNSTIDRRGYSQIYNETHDQQYLSGDMMKKEQTTRYQSLRSSSNNHKYNNNSSSKKKKYYQTSQRQQNNSFSYDF